MSLAAAPRPHAPERSRLRSAALLTAAATVAGLGAFGTYSAWTATTSNGPNTYASGNLKISDDDGGNAMFTMTNMRPNTTQTGCINVTNNGSISFANVNFSGVQSGTLAPSLKIKVERGTGATGGNAFSCTNFTSSSTIVNDVSLSAFPTSASPIADATGWTAGATKSYRVTATLPNDVDNTTQDKSATLTMNWDAAS